MYTSRSTDAKLEIRIERVLPWVLFVHQALSCMTVYSTMIHDKNIHGQKQSQKTAKWMQNWSKSQWHAREDPNMRKWWMMTLTTPLMWRESHIHTCHTYWRCSSLVRSSSSWNFCCNAFSVYKIRIISKSLIVIIIINIYLFSYFYDDYSNYHSYFYYFYSFYYFYEKL